MNFELHQRRLPRPVTGLVLVGGVGLTALLFWLTPAQGTADFVIVAVLLALVALTVTSFGYEGRRQAVNRLFGALVFGSFIVAVLALMAVLVYTFARGSVRLSPDFLTHSMGNVPPQSPAGGVYHAIIGTVEQVGIATIVSVPIALLVAIYITEYGHGPIASAVRFLVDVMTGLPSIVVGLFVLSFWVLGLGMGYSGFAVSIALTILMLPTVIRSAEEMIRLVPDALREASYALGVPKWKTIVRIVLPTAAGGITTGVMLAVARVTGETAPVLLLAGGNNFINNNPFSGAQSSLSLFVYNQATGSLEIAIDRAWAGALVLIGIVVVLYAGARIITSRSSLKAAR